MSKLCVQRPAHPKKALANAFSKAAKTYDQASVLQQEIGNRLLERLSLIKIDPNIILDLGSATGHFADRLKKQYPRARIIELDIAEGMLSHSKRSSERNSPRSLICADAERLPLLSESMDLIFSNCTFHWIFELNTLFEEINRVLKPNGILLFSTFGPDTLQELRNSFSNIDSEKHINYFMDMHNIGDLLLKTGFYDPVVDRELFTIFHKNTQSILQDLKNTGGGYVIRRKQDGLSSKNLFEKLKQEYEHYRNEKNTLPVTFEVIYGYAIKKPVEITHSGEFPITFIK